MQPASKRPNVIYVSLLNKDRSLNTTETDAFNDEETLSPLASVGSRSHEPTATACSSITSMVMSVIGAGTLGIPYAVAQTGWVIAAILFVVVALMNMMTSQLMMECAKQLVPLASYNMLCQRTIPRMQQVVDLIIAVTIFGMMCGYLVVIGDLLPDVVRTIDEDHNLPFLEDRRFWISIMMIVFIFPLVRLKRMDSLKFTNSFAMICFVYVLVIVGLYAFVPSLEPCSRSGRDPISSSPSLGMIFQSAQSPSSCSGKIQAFPSDFKGIFKALPVYFMAYSCQFNINTACNELRHCTMSRLTVINVSSLTICMFIYGIVGFGAYWTFGNEIDNNILLKYPHSNSLLVLRVSLTLAIVFGYPLQARACRSCLSSVLFGSASVAKLNVWQFYGITYGMVLATYGVAMSHINLTHIMGVVGSTGSAMIVFVLPGLFYYRFHFEHREHVRDCRKCIAMFFVIFGILFIPFSLTMQFV